MNTSAVGIMSGTSLDGVDLALCRFNYAGRWSYEIEYGETIRYSDEWTNKLVNASSYTTSTADIWGLWLTTF